MSGVEWRPWPQDARYSVSKAGRVKSEKSGKVLSMFANERSGKLRVSLRDGRKPYVHRMVHEAWSPNQSGEGLSHRDGDPHNNSPENLVRWPSQAKVFEKDLETILARYDAGERIEHIAAAYGVTGPVIRIRLQRAGVDLSARRAERKARRMEREALIAERRARGRPRLPVRWRDGEEHWFRHLNRHYGITPAQFDELVEAQHWMCAACGRPLGSRRMDDGAIRRDGTNPVVDHCHRTESKTHAVRGILHATCNSVLGLAHDDAEVLRRCARYVERMEGERPLAMGNGLGGPPPVVSGRSGRGA